MTTDDAATPESRQTPEPAPVQPKPYVDPSFTANDDAPPAPDLVAELAEMKDRWMRAMAENENTRRRAERDVKEAGQYAIAKFATDMVGVADNLTRALETAPAELRVPATAGAAFVEGVELTGKGLEQILERYGIKPVAALGEKFDPHSHQAMFEMESDQPPGTVVQVMQTGFTLGERVLRPALVGVAKAKGA